MALRVSSRLCRNFLFLKKASTCARLSPLGGVKPVLSFHEVNARCFTGISFGARRCSSTKVAADTSLVDFLKDEIEAEKKLAREQVGAGDAPATVPGFQIQTDEADVTLSKTHGNEKISVKFNVNHSVDSEPSAETDPASSQSQQQQQQQQSESSPPPMVARPHFTVEVEKGQQKLVFECEFVDPYSETEAQGEEYHDLFNIEEVYMYNGDLNDKVYAVSGAIMDSSLYDHLMNYLEERGIDEQFAQDLVRFSTHYEHAQYVALLQKMRDFVGRK